MNRRSFLHSILAAGVSPWVMSNGVAGGILMPVRRLIVPALEPAMLKFYSDSRLIATINLSSSINFGTVERTGVARFMDVLDVKGNRIQTLSISGPRGGGDFILGSERLTIGDELAVSDLGKTYFDS